MHSASGSHQMPLSSIFINTFFSCQSHVSGTQPFDPTVRLCLDCMSRDFELLRFDVYASKGYLVFVSVARKRFVCLVLEASTRPHIGTGKTLRVGTCVLILEDNAMLTGALLVIPETWRPPIMHSTQGSRWSNVRRALFFCTRGCLTVELTEAGRSPVREY